MKYTVTIDARTIEVEVQGDRVFVDGAPIGAHLTAVPQTPLRYLRLDGRARTLAMVRAEDGWSVQRRGETWSVTVLDERTRQLRELTGQGARTAAGGVVKAPMPGLVLRVEVEVGQRVEAGAGVVVLEAMKMENEIVAPGSGTVTAIHVEAGQAVDKGNPLVEVTAEA
jgi:biotin carboxyl carrier protein